MDAMLLTAPDGRVVMANDACVEMFGYTEAELRRVGRQVVVDPSDPRLLAALKERRRTGRFRGELTLRRKDGTRFEAELSSAVFRDEHGVEWTSMFIRDITLRKARQADRERLELASELALRLQQDIEDERRRIARTLHDDLGQRLAVLAMDAADVLQTPLSPAQREQIGEIRTVAREATESMRRIIADLRPPELESVGLEAALRKLLTGWCARFSVTGSLDAQGALEDVPNEVSAALFHVVQEALNNVAKHARARTVRVVLQRQAAALLLQIHDDGIGMPLDAALGKPGHFGLFGINERAQRLGGRLELTSEPGQGVTLRVHVPLVIGRRH